MFHEVLKVTDAEGNSDYDFSSVHVIDPRTPDQYPPNLHATYWPTFGIQAGDEITFKVRGFNFTEQDHAPEVWDFGDGTPLVEVHSVDGRSAPHAVNGYAATQHRYQEPGLFIATVRRESLTGLVATARLQVRVE